ADIQSTPSNCATPAISSAEPTTATAAATSAALPSASSSAGVPRCTTAAYTTSPTDRHRAGTERPDPSARSDAGSTRAATITAAGTSAGAWGARVPLSDRVAAGRPELASRSNVRRGPVHRARRAAGHPLDDRQRGRRLAYDGVERLQPTRPAHQGAPRQDHGGRRAARLPGPEPGRPHAPHGQGGHAGAGVH